MYIIGHVKRRKRYHWRLAATQRGTRACAGNIIMYFICVVRTHMNIIHCRARCTCSRPFGRFRWIIQHNTVEMMLSSRPGPDINRTQSKDRFASSQITLNVSNIFSWYVHTRALCAYIIQRFVYILHIIACYSYRRRLRRCLLPETVKIPFWRWRLHIVCVGLCAWDRAARKTRVTKFSLLPFDDCVTKQT